MATSGTTAFNPDLGEIIEEAFERAGMEMRTGYHIRTARRSLNFLMADWANKGFNLWTVAEQEIAVTPLDATYNLPSDCVDVIEHVVRKTVGAVQTDTNLRRITVNGWANLPNKSQTGTPTQIYVERKLAPQITLWPVPDQAMTVVVWYLRRIQDAGNGVAPTLDIPFRFYNAMAWGLAYHLAFKNPKEAGRSPEEIKPNYDEAFALAAEEDRERVSLFIAPNLRY